MIKELLETQIREQIPTKKCAVLLSGGVDSLSVALAAHNVGKEVIGHKIVDEVKLVEFIKGKSSSLTIERIQKGTNYAITH